MWNVPSSTLKLETIVYTSMYSVFNITLYEWWPCDRSNEGNLFIDIVYQKGYFTDDIDSFTNQILVYIVQTRQVVKIK